MALKLGRSVAQFNRSVTNPIQGQFAWILPPWAVVCQVVRAGRTHELLEPRLVDPHVEPVPRLARPLGRFTGTVMPVRLGPALPGFGRGPAAE